MKRLLAAGLVTAVGSVLVLAPAASAYDKPPELRRVASVFAMRDAEVRWAWRRNEAKIECQAIRHFRAGARLLSASPELANELLPYALAAHARMVRLFPEYNDPTCKLPLWALPFTP
jgi:hypothetical protein